MSLPPARIQQLGDELFTALRTRSVIDPLIGPESRFVEMPISIGSP